MALRTLRDATEFGINLDASWETNAGVHGGWVIGKLMDAGSGHGLHVPYGISASFLGSAKPGRASVHMQVIHDGAQTSTVQLTLAQERPKVIALLKLGLVDSVEVDLSPPPLNPADASEPATIHDPSSARTRMPFDQHLDVAEVAMTRSGSQLHAKIRLSPFGPEEARSEISCHAVVAVLLDALDPLLVARGYNAFVPTVQMDMHFSPRVGSAAVHGRWLSVQQRIDWTASRFCVETSEVRDEHGALMGQARQLRARR